MEIFGADADRLSLEDKMEQLKQLSKKLSAIDNDLLEAVGSGKVSRGWRNVLVAFVNNLSNRGGRQRLQIPRKTDVENALKVLGNRTEDSELMKKARQLIEIQIEKLKLALERDKGIAREIISHKKNHIIAHLGASHLGTERFLERQQNIRVKTKYWLPPMRRIMAPRGDGLQFQTTTEDLGNGVKLETQIYSIPDSEPRSIHPTITLVSESPHRPTPVDSPEPPAQVPVDKILEEIEWTNRHIDLTIRYSDDDIALAEALQEEAKMEEGLLAFVGLGPGARAWIKGWLASLGIQGAFLGTATNESDPDQSSLLDQSEWQVVPSTRLRDKNGVYTPREADAAFKSFLLGSPITLIVADDGYLIDQNNPRSISTEDIEKLLKEARRIIRDTGATKRMVLIAARLFLLGEA